jgi:DNA-binding NtrC family response regulator
LKKSPVVLVVDDDAGMRRIFSEVLETEGCVVKTVETGRQAVAESKKLIFDVVLIDAQLPDMDGIALIDRLRETKPGMIGIIVSGYPSINSAIETMNKNADGYFSKPIDFQELLGMIEKKLKRQREELECDEKKVAQCVETRVESREHEDLGARAH